MVAEPCDIPEGAAEGARRSGGLSGVFAPLPSCPGNLGRDTLDVCECTDRGDNTSDGESIADRGVCRPSEGGARDEGAVRFPWASAGVNW